MSHSPILCPTCDCYIRRIELAAGTRARCPRCHTQLYSESHLDLNGLLALVLTALVLFIPAHLLTVLELNLVGNIRQTSVLQTPFVLFSEQFYIVAGAVLVCGIIAPLLLLLSILTQLVLLKIKRGKNLLRQLLLHHPTLNQLSMVEIFFISFLISIFKLSDFADLTYGWGSLCYILLFTLIFYVQYEYNPERMWHHFERRFK